jgi:hypothetical protein
LAEAMDHGLVKFIISDWKMAISHGRETPHSYSIIIAGKDDVAI